MKILLVISSMQAGGAEKVVSLISNYWAQVGHEILILTIEDKSKKSFYKLNSEINFKSIEFKCGRWPFKKIIKNLCKIIAIRKSLLSEKPNVVISFIDQTNVLVLISSLFIKIPVIVTEHIDPKKHKIGFFWNMLRLLLYPLAFKMVTVSKGILSSFPLYIRKNGTTIYNPIDYDKIEKIRAKFKNRVKSDKIISIGRLTYQKGYDLLIDAFYKISNVHKSWQLEIWGNGEEKEYLLNKIKTLNLQSKVFLPGLTNEPYEKLCNADIFVMSSRYEGFGIVICEAMASGVPVISFDCPSGPSEIITNNYDGLLVPSENIRLLSESIDEMITDETKRNYFVSHSIQTAQKYSLNKIMAKWNDLFQEINIIKH